MVAVVLDSETAPAFYAKRLDLAPEPVATTAAVESAKPPEATGEELEPEATGADPEARQRRLKRYSELSQARDEAKADAAKAREEAKAALEARELAERRAAELQAKYEPPKVEGPGPKPERAQFQNEDEHEKALVEWAGEKAVFERDLKDRAEKLTQSWLERVAATKAEFPDYDEVIAKGADLKVSNEVRDAILESDQGPKIQRHLAANPQLVVELGKMSVNAALRKIGRLEAEFEAAKKPAEPAKAEVKPAVAAPEISRAPAPISPLKAVAETPVVADFDKPGAYYGTAESYSQYKAARKAGRIK